MAIAVNGVTLPDISAEVLAKYPCAGIVEQIAVDGSVKYAFIASGALLFINAELNAEVTGYSTDAVGALDTGRCGECVAGASEWTLDEEFSGGWMLYIGSNNSYSSLRVVWANTDIYEVESVDLTTGEYVLGGIYFLDSTVTFEKTYSAPGAWFVSLAEQARKISGVTKRYTIEEMLSVFASAEALEDAEGMEL